MLKILGRTNSSNVQKVLWACDELELSYQREDIGGDFGGTQESKYLAMNPNGLVPTMIDNGNVLWESNAIIRYLCENHAPNVLLPEDPWQVALAQQWMDWQQTVLAPAIRPVFWGLVRTPEDERNVGEIATGQAQTASAMTILDHHLSQNTFVAGPRMSFGDIPVGIMAYRWFQLDIERIELPHLARWYQSLADRKAYRDRAMIGLS